MINICFQKNKTNKVTTDQTSNRQKRHCDDEDDDESSNNKKQKHQKPVNVAWIAYDDQQKAATRKGGRSLRHRRL